MAYSFAGAPDRFTQALSGTPYPHTLACRVWVNDLTGVMGACTWSNFGTNSAKTGLRKNGSTAEGNAAISSGGNTAFAAGASLSASTWQSLIGVFTSSTSRQCFVEGSGGSVSTVARAITSLDTFLIGVATDAAGTTSPPGTANPANHLVGRVAEVALLNVIWNADQINAHVKGFSPWAISPASIVGHWELIRDLQNSKGGVLTASGAPAVVEHPRVYG